jgi:hypothetical protein
MGEGNRYWVNLKTNCLQTIVLKTFVEILPEGGMSTSFGTIRAHKNLKR